MPGAIRRHDDQLITVFTVDEFSVLRSGHLSRPLFADSRSTLPNQTPSSWGETIAQLRTLPILPIDQVSVATPRVAARSLQNRKGPADVTCPAPDVADRCSWGHLRAAGAAVNDVACPDFANVDLRLAKNFVMGTDQELEVIAQLFNIANRANYNIQSNIITASTSGQCMSLLPNINAPSRQVELAVRYRF